LLIRHVLRCHSIKSSKSSDGVFKLDVTKVCIARALQLFEKKSPYPKAAFLNDWKDAVPYGMVPTEDMLQGYAFETAAEFTSDTLYRMCTVYNLSHDAKTRFSQLFSFKPQWSHAELLPYIRDLCAPSESIDQVLFKFSRAVSLPPNATTPAATASSPSLTVYIARS